MKTLDQMLRELARAEVIEFAVASERLPCVKIGSKYEPIDDAPRSTQAILEMLTSVGGGPYVRDLEKNPAHWTTRVDGIGSVGVQAVMVSGRAQARFAVIVRDAAPAERPAAIASAGPSVKAASPRASRADGLDGLLEAARELSASDIHVVAGRPVLIRVGGELLPRGAPIHEALAEKMVSAIVPERLRATLAEQGLVRLRARPRHARALPRERVAPALGSQGLLPLHPGGRADARVARSARPRSSAPPTTTRVSSWSRAPPATARRARWRRSSTSSTARPRATSSRSRTRSSTSTRASAR